MGTLNNVTRGTRVGAGEIDQVLLALKNRWNGSIHTVGGTTGWSRVLRRTGRIGIVASANALESLVLLDSRPPESDAILTALHDRQVQGEYWSFVSNLNNVPVVDATTAVVDCFEQWKNVTTSSDVRAAAQRSLDWLEDAHDPQGGWGITPGAPFRAYSTAVALRTMARNGRTASPAARSAAVRLVAEQDPATGAWRDSGGNFSAAESPVIRARRSSGA